MTKEATWYKDGSFITQVKIESDSNEFVGEGIKMRAVNRRAMFIFISYNETMCLKLDSDNDQ